jgi:hypothetical protein
MMICLSLAIRQISDYTLNDDNSSDYDIIGGKEIDPGSRPYLVSVGRGGEKGENQFCGGSVISKHAVLTAAHCLFDEDTGHWYPPQWVEFHRHDLCIITVELSACILMENSVMEMLCITLGMMRLLLILMLQFYFFRKL